MIKPVKIILNILLVILLLCASGAIAYWGYFMKQWPWWIALSLSASVFGLFFLIIFLKKYFIRRREKKFVQRIVDHGEVLTEDVLPEQIAVQELEKSWKNNVEILKQSHLPARGNPFYVLPWYLAMGESGEGKSTLLANAGITPAFTEIEDPSGNISATRNCDWVFYDKAIVLDTAGRYTLPVTQGKDQDEWKRFLFLLNKYRRKEPLNGIILFVAADTILNGSRQELKKKGQIIRNRIHTLTRVIGFKIPVCIMVSKMDKLPGFTSFGEMLPDTSRGQVMGQSNDGSPYWSDLFTRTMDTVQERLQTIRLELVRNDKGLDPSFFQLPTEFSRLKTGLSYFLGAVFSENSYQETPELQGLYFASGTTAENPLTKVFSHFNIPVHNKTGSTSSLFAKDFFKTILPACRKHLQPVKEYLVWKKITGNLAFIVWLSAAVFSAGLIGLSLEHNKKVYGLFPTQPTSASLSASDINATIITLEKMRLNILNIEKANRGWKVPFQIFSQSLETEQEYKKKYCELFSSTLLEPMEQGFEKKVDDLQPNTSPETLADYSAYCVEQITYLENFLAHKKIIEFNSFTSVASSVLMLRDKELLEEVSHYFTDLNMAYLKWSNNQTDVEERKERLTATLQRLLDKSGGEVSWLYSNSIAVSEPVTVADFWKHRQARVTDAIEIPAAFTTKGRKLIENLLQASEKALPDNEDIQLLRQRYESSYPLQFLHWWKLFGDNLQDGELELATDSDWREAAILMADPQNPYFSFMERVSVELKQFHKDTKAAIPNWGLSVIAMNDIRKLSLATKKTEVKTASIVAKISAKKDKIEADSLQNIDPKKAAEMNLKLKMAEAWNTYEDALSAMDVITPYKEKASSEFSGWFSQASDPKAQDGGGDSAFSKLYDSFVALHTLATGDYDAPYVHKLVHGPFVFLEDYAAVATAEVLQSTWQEDVVAAARNVDPDKITPLLFDKTNGIVWKYLKDNVTPFVMNSVNGYKARKSYGRNLNFNPDFYNFLNQGQAVVINAATEYKVTLLTQPMEVNHDAVEEPIYSSIKMQCAKKQLSLENDNFPREQIFDWSPEQCGDVVLEIKFPAVKLIKTWKGNMAFAKFLHLFKNGRHTFTAQDFSEEQGHLKDIHVEEITLTYGVTGEKEVLALLNTAPSHVIETIIEPDNQRTAKPHSITKEYKEPVVIPVTEEEKKQPVPDDKKSKTTEAKETKPGEVKPEPQKDKQPTSKSAVTETEKTPWFDKDWLLKQDGDNYTVQIMSLQDKGYLDSVFATLPDTGKNSVYQLTVKDKQWYILYSGNFTTKSDAILYLDSLPAGILLAKPVVKSFKEIQKRINDNQANPKKTSPDKTKEKAVKKKPPEPKSETAKVPISKSEQQPTDTTPSPEK